MFKFLILSVLFVCSAAEAKLKVITSTTDLAEIVRQAGGEFVDVEALLKGSQDPHFVEAKPSYMVKVSKADIVVTVGLGLEAGWISNIMRGARNPKVNSGALGNLELGPYINPLEVLKDTVTRAHGDIHHDGNPHFTLDPIRVGNAAVVVAERLGKLDPPHLQSFLDNAKRFQKSLEEKTKGWANRLEKIKVRKVITYHKTLNYFLARFNLDVPITLEPKPGVPPTASHLLSVIKSIKENSISLVLVENFFDVKLAERVKEEVPGIHLVVVPVAIEGTPQIKNFDDLYESLVKSVEENAK